MTKTFQKIINKNKNRGFTILETLVAIFILILAITGPMVFAQTGLRTAFLARDQITAFFLAQDAIESIKNIRDENALQSRDWLDGIFICENLGPSDPCVISIETMYSDNLVNGKNLGDLNIETCASGSCPVLKNDSNGRFGYHLQPSNDNVDSRFTRNIYMKEVANNKELQIVVEVTWTSNVRVDESRIVVQENIYNWIPRPSEEEEE